MEPVLRLEAIEAIRALKARYFRLMDTKDWAALARCFASDLRVVTPEGATYVEGAQGYADALRASLEDAVSCHQGLTAEIEVTGEDTAQAIWAMQDAISWTHAHPRTGWKAILGRGHYHEDYRFERGAWRIARLMLTRVRLDVTWPDGREETIA